MFRVVQDQLRVSEGWVRCGRCMQTFNATHSLFDPAATPDVGASPVDPRDGGLAAPPGGRADDDRPPRDLFDGAEDDVATDFAPPPDSFHERSYPTPDAPGFGDRIGLSATPMPAPMPAPAPASAFSDSVVNFPSSAAPAGESGPPARQRRSAPPEGADTVLSSNFPLDMLGSAAVVETPEFVRRADRDAFWRQPLVRVLLGLVIVGLTLTLALQITIARRDLIAAYFPEYRNELNWLCASLGCRIEPLRRIDRLSVDSSGLTRIEGGALYRLSLTLRNRADTELKTPAIDLVLTDAGGATIARSVVAVADFGYDYPVIAAGQELPLQAVISAVDRRISGYTIELFYP
jgi:predicted Zn finger-like uncharacterized protein